MHDKLAGHLIEDENGYTFSYDPAYLQIPGPEAVSLTLPLQAKPFNDNTLFPFF